MPLHTTNINNHNPSIRRSPRKNLIIPRLHQRQQARKSHRKTRRNNQPPILAVHKIDQDNGSKQESAAEEGNQETSDGVYDAVDYDRWLAEAGRGPFAVEGAAEFGGVADGY